MGDLCLFPRWGVLRESLSWGNCSLKIYFWKEPAGKRAQWTLQLQVCHLINSASVLHHFANDKANDICCAPLGYNCDFQLSLTLGAVYLLVISS